MSSTINVSAHEDQSEEEYELILENKVDLNALMGRIEGRD